MKLHRLPDAVILRDGSVRIVSGNARYWVRSNCSDASGKPLMTVPTNVILHQASINLMSLDGLTVLDQRSDSQQLPRALRR